MEITVNHPKVRVPTLVAGDSALLLDLGLIKVTNYEERKSSRLDKTELANEFYFKTFQIFINDAVIKLIKAGDKG